MMHPDLGGRSLGRYQLVRRLGEGAASVVYLAVPNAPDQQEAALKVLDPALASRPGFRQRFERDIGRVSAVSHPHILRVHEYGTSTGHTFVAMDLAPGGTLRERMRLGPMDPSQVLNLLSPVADALYSVHQAGVVHMDVKPGNILFDASGAPVVSDFGLARTHLGFATGTPGYMAPEQALGDDVDSRADVYALAVVVFELLTGSALWAPAPVPEMLRTVVAGEVPAIGARRPGLPAELDGVLARALSRHRDVRHQSTIELLWDLARVLGRPLGSVGARLPVQEEISAEAYKGTFQPTGEQAGEQAGEAAEFERSEAQLMKIFETALSASIAVDESSFVIGWNAVAEQTFGWTRQEIVGRSLSSTLIPPRYREAHERGFKHFLETGEGPVLGKVIEITAMHSQGQEFPIELSISPAARSGKRALFVAFARDMTEQRRAGRLQAARDAVKEALGGPRKEAGPAILKAIGGNLGWSVGVLWAFRGRALRSRDIWKADDVECADFEKALADVEYAKGAGVPGRVWSSADGVWVEDVLHEAEIMLALPALRAGLRSVVGVPILAAGEVRGVLEFFGQEVQPIDENLLGRLFDLGRKIGVALAEPDEPVEAARAEGG